MCYTLYCYISIFNFYILIVSYNCFAVIFKLTKGNKKKNNNSIFFFHFPLITRTKRIFVRNIS